MHGESSRDKVSLQEGSYHIVRHKESKIYVCERCGFQTERKSAMALHQKRCLRIKDHKSQHCDIAAVTLKEIEKHVLSKHSDGTHDCDICGKILKSVVTLQLHKRTQHGEMKIFKCSNCQKESHSKNAMIAHEKRCYGIKSHKFDMCEYTAVTSAEIRTHKMFKHPDGTLYNCDLCPKIFKTKDKVLSHKKMVHCEEKQFRCDLCPYMGATKMNIRSHMISHQQEKPFECGSCNKMFQNARIPESAR